MNFLSALLRARFAQACRRVGLNQGEGQPLDITRFRVPSAQRELWD